MVALRAQRIRPLREDGPQRHRVRIDVRIRRGDQRARQGEHRLRAARGRRRDRPARSRRVLPVRPRPREGHRGVAARFGDQFVAARPHRRGVPSPTPNSAPTKAWSATPAKAGGRSTQPSTKAFRCRCCPPPSSSGSRRDGRADVADQVLSAMRAGFGGHIERKTPPESSRRAPPTSTPPDARRINPTPTRSCCSAPPVTSRNASCSRRCIGWRRIRSLHVPVIGVARSDWTDDDFRRHARESIELAHRPTPIRRSSTRCAHDSTSYRATTPSETRGTTCERRSTSTSR